MRRSLSSLCQFLDRPEHGLVEFVWSFRVQTSIKDFAYISAIQPKVYVVSFVDRGVLTKLESEAYRRIIGTNARQSRSKVH